MNFASQDEHISRGLEHRQILIILSGLMSGTMVSALTQTAILTALPTIAGELGGIDRIPWVVSATLITTTASMPLYGKLGDLYGRKLLFQLSILILVSTSILAGLSQNIWHLIVARALQGIGAGGAMTLSQAILGEIVSPRERGRYQGYMISALTISTIVGPLIGGFLVDAASWRWVFFFPVPLGLAAILLTHKVLRNELKRVSRPVDYLGAALLVTGVGCLILAVLWGGTKYPWRSTTILGLGAAVVIITALFIWRQYRAREPLLPQRLFRNSVFTVTNASGFFLGFSLFGAMIFLPVFLQVVTGASATVSGLFLFPLAGGLTVTSIYSGRLISRFGRYKGFAVTGSALLVLSMILLSRLDAETTRVTVAIDMVILGLGLGMAMPVLILAVQNAVDPSDLGTATSSSNFFRSIGSTVGTAIFGAILANRLGFHLTRLVPPADLAGIDPASLRGSPSQILTLPPNLREAVVESFALSVQAVFAAAIPVSIGAFVILLFLKELPLREGSFIKEFAQSNESRRDTLGPRSPDFEVESLEEDGAETGGDPSGPATRTTSA